LKILLLHNSYKQSGGEDLVVQRESSLLAAAGHHVSTYFRDNGEIDERSLVRKIATGTKAVWAEDSYRQLSAILRREKPDLAHFHNTFPLISPSAYYACHRARVPVVQTLHNYRLFCPAGTFFRSGGICEECLEHSLWHSVKHGCYRDSCAGTAAVALMLAAHRTFGTWKNAVNCFIAVSEFVRGKFVAGGLPPCRVFLKPNFVHPDPDERSTPGSYAAFVGRLSAEKGLRTLIAAWANLENRIPLIIVGDGPLRAELERDALRRGLCKVRFDGYLPEKKTLAVMKGARFLVFPSEWYETFGMAVIEAFACGVPVICPRLGAMQDLVADSRTGLFYDPGDFVDLSAKVDWAWTHTQELAEMGRAARAEYEAKYTAAENYRMLMMAYEFALARA
jgi:glycosyltransferase involved in cell wall biosynthesis